MQILEWQRELETLYPHLVKLINIGNSYEGRLMQVIRVSPYLVIHVNVFPLSVCLPVCVTNMLQELGRNIGARSNEKRKTLFFFFFSETYITFHGDRSSLSSGTSRCRIFMRN